MEIKQWRAARKLVQGSVSVTVCTVDPDGAPHATPIGSLVLHHSEPRGYWLEKFPTVMPKNLEQDHRIQIMATNDGLRFWLKSLWQGSFATAPAVRLNGTVGPLRPATDSERMRFLKKVKHAKHLKGYELLWAGMSMARDVKIQEIVPVQIGKMWSPEDSQDSGP